jgi:hypothetical protein
MSLIASHRNRTHVVRYMDTDSTSYPIYPYFETTFTIYLARFLAENEIKKKKYCVNYALLS